MIIGPLSNGLLAGLLRLAMVMAVIAVGATTWAPTAALDADEVQIAAATAVGHHAHHGGPSGDETETPRHTGACVVVCAGGATSLPASLSYPLLRVIALNALLSGDLMRPGQAPDPALRPPRFEALI